MTKKLCDICADGFIDKRAAKQWAIDYMKGGARVIPICNHHTWLYELRDVFPTKKKAQEELLRRSL